MAERIADIRKEYAQQSLSEQMAEPNAIQQFGRWWNEVLEAKIDEGNAMVLSTASADGFPSARIVLMKEFDENGFVFYTNYNSYKARQLEENPKACLVFFWKELERQVRITGIVKKVSDAESDEYFASRPLPSRIGATVSPQSEVIASREILDQQYQAKLTAHHDGPVDRPVYWGGYRVKPVIMEFWQGRPGRLHDRLQYSLRENGEWLIERLAP